MLEFVTWGIRKILPVGMVTCLLALLLANGMAEIVVSMQYPTMPPHSLSHPTEGLHADNGLHEAAPDFFLAAFPIEEYGPPKPAAAGGQTAQKPQNVIDENASKVVSTQGHEKLKEASSNPAKEKVATRASQDRTHQDVAVPAKLIIVEIGAPNGGSGAVPPGVIPTDQEGREDDEEGGEDSDEINATPTAPPAPGSPDNPGEGGMTPQSNGGMNGPGR
jgi:hypothetical protein